MNVGAIDTGSKFATRDPNANPYAGTQYEDVWNSNPYANNHREDSVLDKLGNFFGIRTGADKWADELDVRSQEFDAQLATLAREEEYNSESAKVARMKQAGLNPDLMGIDQASSASEFNEPETSPSSNAEIESIGQVASIASSIFNGFQMATSLLQSLTELRGAKLQNSASSIKNMSSMSDFVSKALLDAVDPRGSGYEFNNGDGNWQFTSDGDFDSLVQKYGEGNVRDFNYLDFDKLNNIRFANKRDQRLFKQTLSRVMNGLPQSQKEFKTWYDREFSRRGYFQKRGSSFFSDDDNDMQLLITPFAEALDKLSQIEVQAATAAEQNDLTYEQNFDAEQLAGAENAENTATANQKTTDAQIEKVWTDLTKTFSDLRKTNPWVGSIGLLVIGFLRSQNLQVHGVHRTQTKTAPNGDVTSYDRNILTY